MDLNSTNVSDIGLDCPDYDDEDRYLLEKVSFVIEGVVQTIVAILGIFGNFLASYILCTRKEMRNAFNLLLVTMACFDSLYLFGSILESFRKPDVFNMATGTHTVLFPYLLYPFTQFAFTASIFMTIAIALERYIAVHYPLDYSQAMHEANALTIRIFKYVSVVVAITCLFTFTKFLEGEIKWQARNDTLTNSTIWTPEMHPTMLRIDPWYTIYYNWSRLLVLGVIPFVMLVYLNAQIFKDIKARSKRRFNTKAGISQSQNNTNMGGGSSRQLISSGEKNDASKASANVKKWFRKKSTDKKMTTLQISGDKVKVIDGHSSSFGGEMTEVTNVNSNIGQSTNKDPSDPACITPVSALDTNGEKINHISKNGTEDNISQVPEISVVTDNSNPNKAEASQLLESNNEVVNNKCNHQGENLELMAQNGKDSSEQNGADEKRSWKSKMVANSLRGKARFIHVIRLTTNRQPVPSREDGIDGAKRTNNKPPAAISVNESRRKKEDNMAAIFMGFIVVFLVCHLPRLLLNIHELFTIAHAIQCMEAGQEPFPLWTGVAISLSQFLLVINSTTNIFIYCCLSSKFREECIKFYQSICRKICC